jgi:hypothetical protein
MGREKQLAGKPGRRERNRENQTVGIDLNASEAIDMHTHVTVSVNGARAASGSAEAAGEAVFGTDMATTVPRT